MSEIGSGNINLSPNIQIQQIPQQPGPTIERANTAEEQAEGQSASQQDSESVTRINTGSAEGAFSLIESESRIEDNGDITSTTKVPLSDNFTLKTEYTSNALGEHQSHYVGFEFKFGN